MSGRAAAPWGPAAEQPRGKEFPDGHGRYGQVLQRRARLRLHQAGRRRPRRLRARHRRRARRAQVADRGAAHLLRRRARQEGQGAEGRQSRHHRLTSEPATRRRPPFALQAAAAAAGHRSPRPMLTLRSSPASPFVRKIRIAANVLGLDRDIAIEPADTMNPSDSVRQQNPLGKIPALVLEDGTVLFDSRVILEYLDHRAGGGRIIPTDAAARFAALRLQALADGIMDASVLLVYEGRWRPAERHEPKWIDLQAGKVARALAALEAAPPALTADPDVGQIALACALGYRDFRFEGTWRRDHPRLVAWLDQFAARVPAFAATKPQG